MKQPIRVLALTSTNTKKHLTWHLRVEIMLPFLRAQGIEVTPLHMPRCRRETRAFLETLPRCDIVWLHRRTLWPSELRRLKQVADHLVLDIDDPVGSSSSNLGNFSFSRFLKFRFTARRASAVLAASDGLVELARAHNRQVFHVPLCPEPARYTMKARHRHPDEPLRLLWLGGASTHKYLEHVRPHLEAVGRACPGVVLTVVGHSPLELQHLPVRNVAWSPEAEREALTASHVGLAPMPNDRWTQAKAALKPLQYLASGLPFVGSSVGVNLRLADDGRNGMLADSPDDWVEAVQLLEANEPLRFRMARNGVAYIQQHHTPEVLAERIGEVFRSLVDQPEPATRRGLFGLAGRTTALLGRATASMMRPHP